MPEFFLIELNWQFYRFCGKQGRLGRKIEKAIQRIYTAEQSFKQTKSMFEVYQIKNLLIEWSYVPDVMNKDPFYPLRHISKSTALHLPKSGKVPCACSGKKTQKL